MASPTDEAMKEEIITSVCYRSLKVKNPSLEEDERILSLLYGLDASKITIKDESLL